MVTPASLRQSQEPTAARPPVSRRGLLGLVVTVAVVWGLSQGWAHWQGSALANSIKGLAKEGNVVMYTTSSCPYCAKARDWLATHGIAYRDCNVDVEAQCQADYVAKGQPGVPLMRVNDRWQLGFDPQWVALALESSNTSPSKSQP
jgi:glutaredoxin